MSGYYKPWSFGTARSMFWNDAASVLNVDGDKIYVYDVQSGKRVRVLTLPEQTAIVDVPARQGDLVPVYMQDKSVAIVRIPK